MKTIGLIGGMSWESTALYYQAINRGVAHRQGGLHSARLVMTSVNFAEIAQQQRDGDWAGLAEKLSAHAQSLVSIGAETVLICTNTMHKVADDVQAAIAVPLLHIVEPTAAAIRSAGLTKIGLLGTQFTMAQPFLKDRYAKNGVDCIVPPGETQADVHRIIFEELCRGVISDASRDALARACAALVDAGAQGVVLGCTELTLSLKPQHVAIPLFDTTDLHAQAAVDFALS